MIACFVSEGRYCVIFSVVRVGGSESGSGSGLNLHRPRGGRRYHGSIPNYCIIVRDKEGMISLKFTWYVITEI